MKRLHHILLLSLALSGTTLTAQNKDTAKEFLMHLVGNYNLACEQSEFYNFPAWPSTVPDLPGWLENDPYGSEPADKLNVLATANDWTTNLGHPGPANAAMGEIFALPILPNMMARAARGEQTAAESVAQADPSSTGGLQPTCRSGAKKRGGGLLRRPV